MITLLAPKNKFLFLPFSIKVAFFLVNVWGWYIQADIHAKIFQKLYKYVNKNVTINYHNIIIIIIFTIQNMNTLNRDISLNILKFTIFSIL
jgi:hypothetical protein